MWFGTRFQPDVQAPDMISSRTLDFLRNLKANNSREWFQEHREAYDLAYADFFDTVARIVSAVSVFDADIAAASLDPKSCIMRIYRDMRFSRDKKPYKTGFFAYLSAGGRKGRLAGYYLHLEPGGTFGGGGLYLPAPEVLDKTRRAIDAEAATWRAIVTGDALTRQFPAGVLPSGSTKRPPKGYAESNPVIEWLRYKGYFTQRFFDDDETMDTSFIERLAESYRASMPLVKFLDRAIAGRWAGESVR